MQAPDRQRRRLLIVAGSTCLASNLARAQGAVAPPAGAGASPANAMPSTANTTPASAFTAPLLAPWPGPYGGVPPFDLGKTADFKPALTEGMALSRAEIDAIAADPAAPTFDNTVLAFEMAGAPMNRALAIYGVHTSTLSDDPLRAVEAEMSPVLAAFTDATTQNAALFKRFDTLRKAAPSLGLSDEQRRLLELDHRAFARAGAGLNATDKARVAAINQRLATLYTRFSQNELADEQAVLVLTSEADLAGLPVDVRESAAAAAIAAGKPGQWHIANTRSAMEPFITASTERDLREKGWRLWVSRGDNNDAHDNKAVVAQVLQWRAERAHILGFKSHAHWITDDNMARTPEAALALMMKVWRASSARAREEIADMQAVADREGAKLRIEPWDYRFYAEKVRQQKYAFDGSVLKPYLQLDKMREAMFWAAGEVHGFSFQRVQGLPVPHPDVTVYTVHRGGEVTGLWYFDPYARAGKNSGAWMSEYRTQENRKEKGAGRVLPIVSNNANFIKGKPGEPVLVTWDDAITMFHEFGHALHGLSSNVTYASLAGTNVKRDFVEFPSQLNERWLPTPEVLNRFALHVETGKPMPAELLASIKRAHAFNQGFSTSEYLAAAIYDMRIHMAPAEPPIDPNRFERELMAEIGCPSAIVMRHRPTQFGHSFAGEGYSAGYYAYLWADVITADAAEAFVEVGSFYDKATAKRLHEQIFAVGGTVPPDEAFRRFRGRDTNADALMRDRGFAVG